VAVGVPARFRFPAAIDPAEAMYADPALWI
jgi:hypothetical protein